MDSNLKTEEVFESAVSIVRNLPKEGSIKPSNELKLKLYALFKQATHGPNDTPKPRFYQIVEAYKWEAWRDLGDMSKRQAMLNYIDELKKIMDSIPSEEANLEDTKHFEDVLGKKFYDYWFNQWKQSGGATQLEPAPSNERRKSGSNRIERSMTQSNDTQSNSSSGSSMSMLEDTQSAGDGYKTPNSTAFKETFTGEVSDQFAMALLRLQHGLDGTITRMDKLESCISQISDRIRALENQTSFKQPHSRTGLHRPKNLIRLLRSLDLVHWFYLSYPFLVYFIIGTIRRRNKNTSRLR